MYSRPGLCLLVCAALAVAQGKGDGTSAQFSVLDGLSMPSTVRQGHSTHHHHYHDEERGVHLHYHAETADNLVATHTIAHVDHVQCLDGALFISTNDSTAVLGQWERGMPITGVCEDGTPFYREIRRVVQLGGLPAQPAQGPTRPLSNVSTQHLTRVLVRTAPLEMEHAFKHLDMRVEYSLPAPNGGKNANGFYKRFAPPQVQSEFLQLPIRIRQTWHAVH